MNTRIITAILSFVVTFGFSVSMMQLFKNDTPTRYHFLQSGESRTNQKIVGFLRQDIRNGSRMDRVVWEQNLQLPPTSDADLAKYADAVAEYVNKSESMDDSDLPQDLRCAWRRHMKAWRAHATFLNRTKALAESGNFPYSESEMVSTFFTHDRQINETWSEVLLTARTHTELPAYIY